MATSVTSQIQGVTAGLAIKAPVRTVATTNITLSGLQTINGVSLIEGDRVLLIAQTSSVYNGIYNASSGTWTRAKDFDGNRDIVKGTLVSVEGGSGSPGSLYEVVTSNPIVVGTSSIEFVQRYSAGNVTYDIIDAENDALVTPTNYAIPSPDITGFANPLRYGADDTGATSSQVAFDAAKAVAAQGYGIEIPAGDFKVNWVLQDSDADYLYIKTAGFRTRLIPVSSASPVVDIYGSASGGGVTGLRFESCLIDSQLSGVPTGAGIGFRVRGATPGFVWKCRVGHIYIRGFDDGFQIDCDTNIGEVFDNDFDQIEVLDCDDRSLDIDGIYNRFGRIFVTNSGNYAVVMNASQCTIDQIVTDGPVTCAGASCVIGKVVIEGIHGSGASQAVEVNNSGHQFRQITLKEIPAAKCPIGVSFGSLATAQIIGDIVVTGTDYPTTPISLTAGSSGVMGSASIPGGTKISTSTSVISNWRFIGDVSSAFIGDRYLNTNLLVENSGRLKQVTGGKTEKRLGLTYSSSIATDASLASHFTITVTNGTAFTIQLPSNAEDGAEIEYTIYNSSGGAMGAITWTSFKMSAWTNPANGSNRSIRFRYDGSFWTQVSQTGVDVPN